MGYLPHTSADRAKMLEVAGVSAVDELFAALPESVRLGRPLRLPEALTEHDLVEHMESMAARNLVADRRSFLGAGAYRHFIPTVVDTVISRSEYLTAYTPYQPEASQGTLQTIFEFQTCVARLTGMEAANASVYDGGTASSDAVFLALGQTGRRRVLVSQGVHPHTREILATYLAAGGGELEELPLVEGRTPVPEVGPDVAALLFQVPNYLGVIEDGPALCRAAQAGGALALVSVMEPVSLAVLKAPGHYGADVVAGEAQGVGLPVSYGGPYAGFMATRSRFLRRMPGRLVGLTTDHQGGRGYCLTLQAREQHIRREKASSSICTNQGLCALAVTAHLALLGPQGLREQAEGSMASSAYARQLLGAIPGCSIPIPGPFFHEFPLRTPVPPVELNRALAKMGILGGVPLGGFDPGLEDCMLICCTELNRKQDVEALAQAVAEVCAGRMAVEVAR